MRSFSELHDIIEKELSDLYYPSTPKNLYDPIKYILNIGGKRIRPILMLLSHQLFSEDIEKSLKAALGIEVFHNFTLLHDDIMDEAPLRRGLQTVHEKWDNNTAILSGDAMLVQSYRLVSDVELSKLRDVFDVFNKAAKEVCEGQQWDMDFEERENVSINEYLKMIEYKTSVLLASSLKIGAINGGATKQDADNIYEFGKNMGIAFQLKDDFLDTFGNSATFGKQIGNDIISNKKTYLYLKALEDSDEKHRSKLIEFFSTNIDSQDKVDDVKSIFTDLEIPRKTMDLIKEYNHKSLNYLGAINSKNKKPLLDFAKLLIDRDK